MHPPIWAHGPILKIDEDLPQGTYWFRTKGFHGPPHAAAVLLLLLLLLLLLQ
jgi:hypothetical protein